MKLELITYRKYSVGLKKFASFVALVVGTWMSYTIIDGMSRMLDVPGTENEAFFIALLLGVILLVLFVLSEWINFFTKWENTTKPVEEKVTMTCDKYKVIQK